MVQAIPAHAHAISRVARTPEATPEPSVLSVLTLPLASGYNYNQCNLARITQPLPGGSPDHTRILREHYATQHVPTPPQAGDVLRKFDANGQLAGLDMPSVRLSQLDRGPPDRCTLGSHPQVHNQHPGLDKHKHQDFATQTIALLGNDFPRA
jgi:hypothetical protein